MQRVLTSIVGLRCNRQYGGSNSSFFFARTVSAAVYGMRSLGFWTSSWIRMMTEGRGSVKVARMFPPNLRALSG